MRVFWALIAVLVLIVGVMLGASTVQAWLAHRAAESAARARDLAKLEEARARNLADRAMQELESLKLQEDGRATHDPPASTPDANLAPTETATQEAPTPEEESKLLAADVINGLAAETPMTDALVSTEVSPNAKPDAKPDANLDTREAQKPADVAASDGAPAEAKPVDTPAPAKPSTEPAAGAFEVVPAKIDKKEDGSLLIDDRYVVKGDGTLASPYRITWELLTSAEDTYDPRRKKKQIPERIAMLDGKHVRISGYVAFPLQVKEPRELLAMLNQWDGCCIGVPPTPYDAIEVQLKESVKGQDQMAVAGAVSGKFAVKPYVVGDWLVGLYVLEEAKLTVLEFGAGAHGQ